MRSPAWHAPSWPMSNDTQYSAEQKAAVAAVVSTAAALAAMYGVQLLTLAGWRKLLEALFPLVAQQRTASAMSARRFYDAQRRINFPTVLQHDIELPATTWDGFVQAMEPARREVVKQVRMSAAKGDPVVPDKIARPVVLQTAKVVQDAGRDTIVKAAETDQIPDVVDNLERELKDAVRIEKRAAWGGNTYDVEVPDKPTRKDLDTDYAKAATKIVGWARVATGDETCGWCWMLVSRGPVYTDAASAGLDNPVDDIDALEELGTTNGSQDLKTLQVAARGHMTEWHPGCDCIAVPVFDRNNWVGRDTHRRALEDWKAASSAATKVIDNKAGDKKRLTYRTAKRNKDGSVELNDNGGMIYRDTTIGLGAARSREAVNAMRVLQAKGPDGLERWLERKLGADNADDVLDELFAAVPGAKKLFRR